MRPLRCVLLVFTLCGCARMEPAGRMLSEAELVENCQPCSFKPGHDSQLHNFVFDFQRSEDERTITGIQVRAGGKLVTRLEIKDMMPIGLEEPVFFGPQDINFDGYQDLLLVTEKGTANSNAEYWLYDPAAKSFRPVGMYALFNIDRARKQLTTYDRGGQAGLLYEARVYEWRNGNLTMIREELQEPGDKPNTVRRTVRELVDDQMRVTSTKTLSEKAAAQELRDQ